MYHMVLTPVKQGKEKTGCVNIANQVGAYVERTEAMFLFLGCKANNKTDPKYLIWTSQPHRFSSKVSYPKALTQSST